MLNKITHEPFESAVLRIEGNSIDCIITDPPNLLSVKDGKDFSFQEDKKDQLFANFDIDFFAQQTFRVCKNKSSILVFGHSNFQRFIHESFQKVGLIYVSDLVWVKPNGVNFMLAKQKPMSSHELITLYKKKQLNFNYLDAKTFGHNNYFASASREKGTLYDLKRDRLPTDVTDNSRYMTTVADHSELYYEYPDKTIYYANRKNQSIISERTSHPTQKPLELINQYVKAFSFESQIVLDLFSGSGTTAESCIINNRNFIAIEKEFEYYQSSTERINKAFERKTLGYDKTNLEKTANNLFSNI